MPYGPCLGIYVAAKPGGGGGSGKSRGDRRRGRPIERKKNRLGGGGAAGGPRKKKRADERSGRSSSSSSSEEDDGRRSRDPFDPACFWRDQRIFDPKTGRFNLTVARSAVTSASPLKNKKTTKKHRPSRTKSRRPSDDVGSNARQRNTLVPENRLKNITDREEGVAVQYLVLGGHRRYVTGDSEGSADPFRAASALHAGPGQMAFGWDYRQRADLFLAYAATDRAPARLCYHNHHESGTHYTGHLGDCPRARRVCAGAEGDQSRPPPPTPTGRLKIGTERADAFKAGLAECLSNVYPDRVTFGYTTTTSCDLFHGTDRCPIVPTTRSEIGGRDGRMFATALEACLAERADEFLYVSPRDRQRSLDVEREVLPGVRSGSLTGFLTIKGGRESTSAIAESPAAARFGFCVQKYAPSSGKISEFTKQQISELLGHENADVTEAYVKAQAPRTLNSGTFHVWETVTTSYLRWLMRERGFAGFRVRHLLVYKFNDEPKNFLEPVLQRRHDSKRQGNTVAAECLKLIGNGSFGYNALEAINYSCVRLMTGETIKKKRLTSLAEADLKHITMIGMIRVRSKTAKKKKRRMQRRRTEGGGSWFLDDSALDQDGGSSESEDGDDDDSQSERSESSFDEEEEIRAVLGLDAGESGQAEEEESGGDDKDDGEDDDAVLRQDRRLFSKCNVKPDTLYAVEVSGARRRLFNNLPKAVAVLGNSKRLFFSHLHTMLRCLDPALAELCYVDTDSCLWSLTYQSVEECLLDEKRGEWARRDIIADESSPTSCHGKLKLEGTYRAGLFKTTKIYRLFDECVYTRCKGVNRHIAERLEDRHFDVDWNNPVTVHRTCLRPTRTGEIVIASEAKSLSVPFNFKRHVTRDGVHSLPFSSLPRVETDAAGDDGEASSSSSSSSSVDDDEDDDDDDDDDDEDDYEQQF